VTAIAQYLPAGYAVGRVSVGDAIHVVPLLRAGDRAELEALVGQSALDVLRGWITDRSRVLTIHGEPSVVFGIEPSTTQPGHAMPWSASVSTLPFSDMMNVLWLSRLQVDFWQRRWPVLDNLCDARNGFHRHWLEWLGFEPAERVERFGAARLPFDLYSRSRGVVLH
jgi:hypothetical protein